MAASGDKASGPLKAVALAWLITSVFYFYQYVMRSAPAVMVPLYKWEKLWLEYKLSRTQPPSKEMVAEAVEIFRAAGLRAD